MCLPFESVGPPLVIRNLEFGRAAPLRANRCSFGTRLAGYLIGWAYWAVIGRGVSPGEGRTQPGYFSGVSSVLSDSFLRSVGGFRKNGRAIGKNVPHRCSDR